MHVPGKCQNQIFYKVAITAALTGTVIFYSHFTAKPNNYKVTNLLKWWQKQQNTHKHNIPNTAWEELIDWKNSSDVLRYNKYNLL